MGCPDPARPSPTRAGVNRRRRARPLATSSFSFLSGGIARRHQHLHSFDQRHGRADRGGLRILEQMAIRVGEAHPPQPILEFRSASPTERLADIEDVVERQALIVQHHVVSAGNRDNKGDPADAQQRQQHIHIVLIGFGMIGVANIASHRQAEQLAAEMILQPGADDLLAVDRDIPDQ